MTRFTDRIIAVLDRISRILAFVGGVGVVAAMAMIVGDVCLRQLGTELPATYEIVVNYFMLMIAFLPLMRVERLDEMISVEVVSTLAGPRVNSALLYFASLISFVVYAGLSYTTWLQALQKLTSRSYVIAMDTAIPTWPAYFVLPLAFTMAALAMLARFHDQVEFSRADARSRSAEERA